MKKGRLGVNAKRGYRLCGALWITASVAACNNPAASPDYIPQGSLTATILDQGGAPVAGADLQVLDKNTSFVWAHGVSGTDGLVLFNAATNPITPTTSVGLLGGSYRAQLTAPTGYVVPSTQADPAIIQVGDKRTTYLTMRVAKGL